MDRESIDKNFTNLNCIIFFYGLENHTKIAHHGKTVFMLLPLVGKFCVFFQITGGELEKNTKFAHIFVVIHASQIVGNFCVFFQITGCELENDTKTAHLGEELKFSC